MRSGFLFLLSTFYGSFLGLFLCTGPSKWISWTKNSLLIPHFDLPPKSDTDIVFRSSLAPGNSHLNEELFLPDNGRIRQTKERYPTLCHLIIFLKIYLHSLAQFFPDGGHFSTRSWLAPNLRIVILQAQGTFLLHPVSSKAFLFRRQKDANGRFGIGAVRQSAIGTWTGRGSLYHC